MIKRALVSVTDKTGVVEFCTELNKLGYEVISTGNTFKMLKEQGVKTTEVETLNIYYLPETAKVFFVAIKKDGSELKGELDVNAMPEYPEVVKKTAAKKAPAKKAPAKAVAAKEAKPVVKKATTAKKTTKK